MFIDETSQHMIRLTNELRKHNHLYYIAGEPEITDEEYDQLRRKLIDLEQKHPEFKVEFSPTDSVGDSIDSNEKTRAHKVPMLSLGNALNKDELFLFLEDILKRKDIEQPASFIVEKKYDGIAASLTYVHGKLIQALTRGDGMVGEIITERVAEILNLPYIIPELSAIASFEVRGEILMPKDAFKRYNERAQENGQRVFSNPRNAVAGSIRQKQPLGDRPLAFYAYSINQGLPSEITKQSQCLALLAKLGFEVGDFEIQCSINKIMQLVDDITLTRDVLPIEIDGLVIKLDNLKDQLTLGTRTREPRWAIAYKFPAKSVLTKLNEVIWTVGRVGQITPVGILEPVEIGGVTVGRVTLHNAVEVYERLGLMLNDVVTLERAGDVIPKITKAWTELRDDTCQPIVPPTCCPSCGAELPESVELGMIFCPSGLTCPAQMLGHLSHFASKECMDIDGLAESTIAKLIESGLLSTADDYYALKNKTEELRQLEGMGGKAIIKLLNNIERSKEVSLAKFIYALGIKGVGNGTTLRLCERYETLDDFLRANLEELSGIRDIGPITAANIYNFISDTNNLAIIERLLEQGVQPINTVDATAVTQTCVITGKFDKPRAQLVTELLATGVKVTGSVTADTSFLLLGEGGEGTSKHKKAIKLGTKIVTVF